VFRADCPFRYDQAADGDYAQHLAVLRGASDACDEHPHPVPPLDFMAASWAQHALTSAGTGPPQQLSGWVFRDSSEVVVF
jgi:hypothetical protein